MIQKDREKMHQDYNAWSGRRNMTAKETQEKTNGIRNRCAIDAFETFTWYDYPARRNRRIIMKRHIIMGLFILAVWGATLWLVI